MATAPRLDDPNPSVGNDDNTPMPATLGDGRYEVRRRIGEGGFAFVYLAYDRNLDAEVAIKMLKSTASEVSPGIRQRFVREGRLMTRLRMKHPTLNIVHVTNVVDTKEECFYVMDVIRSDNAKDRLHKLMLRGKTVKPEQVLHVATEVLKALVVLHAEGIVHCDIKPENVLIAPNKRILLMDFGTAHDDNFAMTKAGDKLMGTLAYMAPEVYEREDYTSEPRRDIYAVGALIYELATGKQPKRLDNCIYEQAKLLVLPAALRPIVLKATHRVAEERYQTAQEMLDELERVQKEIETNLDGISADAPDSQPSFTPPGIDPATVAEAGAIPVSEPEPKPLPPPAKSPAQLARERLDRTFGETQQELPRTNRWLFGAVIAAALGITAIGWFALGSDPTPEPMAETLQIRPVEMPTEVKEATSTATAPAVQVTPTIKAPELEAKPTPKAEAPKPQPKATKPTLTVVAPEPVAPLNNEPTLTHRPIASATFSGSVAFLVHVEQVPAEAAATLRYRASGAGPYTGVIAMTRQGNTYSAMLKVDEDLAQGFDYFIVVEGPNGLKLQEGKPLKPYKVAVQ